MTKPSQKQRADADSARSTEPVSSPRQPHVSIRFAHDGAALTAREIPDLLAGPMPFEDSPGSQSRREEWARAVTEWLRKRKRFAALLLAALREQRLRAHDPNSGAPEKWIPGQDATKHLPEFKGDEHEGNQETYTPTGAQHEVSDEADELGGQLIRCDDLVEYFRQIGISIEISDYTARPTDETPAARRARLLRGHQVLKSQGDRSPTRTLARREGISESMLRRLLKDAKAGREQGSTLPASPFRFPQAK